MELACLILVKSNNRCLNVHDNAKIQHPGSCTYSKNYKEKKNTKSETYEYANLE